MLGLGSFTKMVKGVLRPDEMAEMMSALGMDVSIQSLAVARESFDGLGRAASLPDAKIVELKGTTKDGGNIYALIVMNHGSTY